MKRVLFVIPSLAGGGAEKACVTILQAIDRDRIQPELCIFQSGGAFADSVPADVPIYVTAGRAANDLRLPFKIARLLRARRPDAALSIQRYANVSTIMGRMLSGLSVPLIVNEQNRPSFEFAYYGGGRFKRWMLKTLYPHADIVSAISQGIASELAQQHRVDPKRIRVIHNPIDLAHIHRTAQAPPPHLWLADAGMPTLVAAGRLVPQKGFDLLLHAMVTIRQTRRARLLILGEGPERSALEKLRDELGLAGTVEFPGFQSNPSAFYTRAAVFVLSSRYEGFGNVIVEAMACGAPVVSFRCPSGPDEIIEPEVSGLLVPAEDTTALSRAILRRLADPALSERLRAGGRTRAGDFAAPRIANQYAELIESICVS